MNSSELSPMQVLLAFILQIIIFLFVAHLDYLQTI